jgi:hypothetical protein
MAVTFDKLLGKPLLHGHKFTTFEMVDSAGTVWTVSITTLGQLTTASLGASIIQTEDGGYLQLENNDYLEVE